MDRFIDVVKLGPGAVIGAILGFVLLGPVIAPESKKPDGCGDPIPVSMSPGVSMWQCLKPDGTWARYQGQGFDDVFISGILGGLGGAGFSWIVFNKVGWGESGT
jgi:hypothetical protein